MSADVDARHSVDSTEPAVAIISADVDARLSVDSTEPAVALVNVGTDIANNSACVNSLSRQSHACVVPLPPHFQRSAGHPRN
ncbi:hypothetical protein J6590_005773 [Homalodisca vitripennis]|nr:hypothetical protein J6590_005773 [Homalodisca vitripennis]